MPEAPENCLIQLQEVHNSGSPSFVTTCMTVSVIKGGPDQCNSSECHLSAVAKQAEMLAFPCIALSMKGGVQNTTQLSKTLHAALKLLQMASEWC